MTTEQAADLIKALQSIGLGIGWLGFWLSIITGFLFGNLIFGRK